MLYVHKFTGNAAISTEGFWVGDHVCWNETTGAILITTVGPEYIRLESAPGVNYPRILNVFTTSADYPLEGSVANNTLTVSLHDGASINKKLDSSLAGQTVTLSLASIS